MQFKVYSYAEFNTYEFRDSILQDHFAYED